jgi:PAS domain S-box-containing protein
LTYFVFGLVWIFTSDRVLETFATRDVTVTDLQTYKGWAYVSVTAALLYGLTVTLVARLGAARDRLRETRENFRRLVESSHDGMWAVDVEGKVVEANARLVQILGVPKEQLLGDGVDQFLMPETFAAALGGVEEPTLGRDARIVRFRRANEQTGWGIVSSVSLTDADGLLTGELRVLTDITRTKQAEEALRTSLQGERTLLNELDHRVRNNLASLLTLIDLTKHSAAGVNEFAKQIRGRVGAMAATHSLLAESKFTMVDMTRLFMVITEGEQEHRLIREGPPVVLGPSQAGPMAMILQELWANSVKHGALGSSHGRVRVRWHLVEREPGNRVLTLIWNDEDGPPVHVPEKNGFGLTLVKGLVESDLHGSLDVDFAPLGAVFRIEFPLPILTPAGS